MSTTDTSTDTSTERAEFTAGLRAMADWFDQHPELNLPYEASSNHHAGGVRFSIGIQEEFDYEDDDFVDDLPGRFAEAVKALGGARKKDATDGYMRVTRKFGPGVNVEIWAARDKVCEAVVVGKKKVEVQQIVRPVETITVVEEQDVIEWRCAPVLSEATA